MDKRLVRFGLLSLLLVGAAIFWVVQKQKPAVQVQKVGMLLPLEHEAMTQEVAGFREELQAVFGENVQIDVKNAQGDVGIQRALLLQFAQGDYQAVAVVGTTASLMALQIFASSSSNR
ncbi:MAG: ABC transporter substrate binding protein, partial [Myxococcota bacterium]